MKWAKALWAALLAFFAALQGKEDPQDVQDHIVQETQHEIEEVPTKTDDELTDIAIDTGLVHSEDPGGSSRSEPGAADVYTRCGSSFKTKH